MAPAKKMKHPLEAIGYLAAMEGDVLGAAKFVLFFHARLSEIQLSSLPETVKRSIEGLTREAERQASFLDGYATAQRLRKRVSLVGNLRPSPLRVMEGR